MSVSISASEVNHKGKRVPAEFEPQEAIWMQWPGYWEKDYEKAFAKIVDIISRYEKLHILYHSDQVYADAQKSISDTKADLENLMKQRIADKDKELADWKSKVKTINVDSSILSLASKNNAIAPDQVVSLLKNEVNYNDDGRVEILDNNKNIRYNSKGELLTIEDRVNEFLDANPHFRKGSLSGTGSQSSIEGKTVKPFNIQDLDMGKAEDRKKYAEYRKQRDSSPVQINLNNNK